jgi:hypothetical protein
MKKFAAIAGILMAIVIATSWSELERYRRIRAM